MGISRITVQFGVEKCVDELEMKKDNIMSSRQEELLPLNYLRDIFYEMDPYSYKSLSGQWSGY